MSGNLKAERIDELALIRTGIKEGGVKFSFKADKDDIIVFTVDVEAKRVDGQWRVYLTLNEWCEVSDPVSDDEIEPVLVHTLARLKAWFGSMSDEPPPAQA